MGTETATRGARPMGCVLFESRGCFQKGAMRHESVIR
jgi:hypothetical protein